MKINRNLLFSFLLLPVFVGFSFYLISNYIYGDQVHYRALYSALSDTNFSDALGISKLVVSGNEPISAWLLWVGASLNIDKDIYITFFNVFLLFALTSFLRREKASWLVIFLILTNFYVVVLMTGAERLKFGYLFIAIASLFKGNLRWFLLSLAPFAHLQMVIFLVGIVVGYFSDSIKKVITYRRLSKKTLKFLLPILVFILVILTILGPAISSKIKYYDSSGVLELFQVTALLFVALFVSKEKFRILLVLVSMATFVFILGGDRVNMIAFSLAFYFLAIEKKLSSPLFMLILIYLSYKSIGFVYNISRIGTGFT